MMSREKTTTQPEAKAASRLSRACCTRRTLCWTIFWTAIVLLAMHKLDLLRPLSYICCLIGGTPREVREWEQAAGSDSRPINYAVVREKPHGQRAAQRKTRSLQSLPSWVGAEGEAAGQTSDYLMATWLVVPTEQSVPHSFSTFLQSAASSTADVVVFSTVDLPGFPMPGNVKLMVVPWESVVERLEQVLLSGGKPVQLPGLRPLPDNGQDKANDIQPLTAALFPEVVAGYKYWGYCNSDIVLGDVATAMSTFTQLPPRGREATVQAPSAACGASNQPCDVVSLYGRDTLKRFKMSRHFALYRNTEAVNTMYQKLSSHGTLHTVLCPTSLGCV